MTLFPFSYHIIVRLLFSKEGIDVLFGCWKASETPAAFVAANDFVFTQGDIQLSLFARPSTGASALGPVPVADWWGYCEVNKFANRLFNTKTGVNLSNMYCIGKTVTLNELVNNFTPCAYVPQGDRISLSEPLL